MTLLWATKVIDQQYKQDQHLERNSTKLGIGRAGTSELEELFRPRFVRGGSGANVSMGGSGKSVDLQGGWRKAF